MGDIADYYNEYYDHEDEEPPAITCKYCGTDNLEWHEIQGVWRLYDCDGNKHICGTTVTAANLAKVWK